MDDVLAMPRQPMEEAVLLEASGVERSQLPAVQKTAAFSTLRRHDACSRLLRTSVAAVSGHGSAGEPLLASEGIGALLHRQRSGVFAKQPMDAKDTEFLLRFTQPAGKATDWRWGEGCTRDIATGLRDSVPGTDGLGYAFWAQAPAAFYQALDKVVDGMQQGGNVPKVLADTATVVLPKAEQARNAETVRYTAATVRPITRVRRSAKIAGWV